MIKKLDLKKIKKIFIWLLLLSPLLGWGQQEDAQEVIRIWQTRDKANELRTRLSNDFDDVVAVEALAQLYYYDFLDMNGGVRFADADRWDPDSSGRYNFPHLESAFSHCADSALWYMLHLWSRNPEEYEHLYYAIVQLENFLGARHTAYILPPEDYYKGKFFPDSYFTSFGMTDWEHNYTVDLFQGMKNARVYARGAAQLLADMDENELYSATVVQREEAFRVLLSGLGFCQLYLVETEDDVHTLYYKEGQMNPQRSIDGGFHYSIAKNKKKVLSAEQWQEFNDLLDSAAFAELPHNSTCSSGTDIQVYLYEQLRHDGYHAHRTGCPDVLQRQIGRNGQKLG